MGGGFGGYYCQVLTEFMETAVVFYIDSLAGANIYAIGSECH